MHNGNKILAVIPAKGKSKRLPEKNLKHLAGKPLVGWTIEQAKASQVIDYTVLSTDCKKIAYIAEGFGVDRIIDRPPELATDTATTEDVVLHVLQELPDKYNIIVMLQPTSPLRYSTDIDEAVKLLVNTPKATSVVGITQFKAVIVYLEMDRIINDVTDHEYYRSNGAIYVIYTKALEKEYTFYTKYCKHYLMPENRSVDIDTYFDFDVADCLMRRRLNESSSYRV